MRTLFRWLLMGCGGACGLLAGFLAVFFGYLLTHRAGSGLLAADTASTFAVGGAAFGLVCGATAGEIAARRFLRR